MITRDYHGTTLEKALRDAETIVDSVRLNRTLNSKPGQPLPGEDVQFITGHGVIRGELMNLLRDNGLDPSFKLGNDGVIVCYVE